jgi:hypothetical protein
VPQQREVARFARDLIRLMGAVIAEHFCAKTIAMISGYPQLDPVPAPPPRPIAPMITPAPAPAVGAAGLPPVRAPVEPCILAGPNGRAAQAAPVGDNPAAAGERAIVAWEQWAAQARAVVAANLVRQQQFDAAVELLRQDGVHGFRIDIETDSTIAPDEQAEKRARVEFLQQMVPLLEQVVPLATGNPALASLCRDVTLFAARGFRVARTLEESIEHAFDALAQTPPGDPSAAKRERKQARGATSGELAIRAHEIDSRTQVEREKNAIVAAKAASNQQLEQARLASETATERARLAMEAERLATDKASLNLRTDALAAREAKELT